MQTLNSWNTVGALWLIFCIYWAFSALAVKRTKRTEPVHYRFGTVAVLATGAFLIFSRRAHFGVLSARFLPEHPWIQVIGIMMTALGVALAIWARRHIGQYWSARVTLKEDHQLIQSGSYARVRHPIYSGILLAMIGTALFVGEWRAVVGVFLVFMSHWQKARREEKLLAGQFGTAYEEYCGRTGSLLPRLH